MSVNPVPRVLVVDNERPIRHFLRISLGSAYTIFDAENGAQALRMVATDRPDLVILDLGLPDMTGLDVIQHLREWTLVPVIVISIRDREQDKVAALDAGADDYLTKPFSIEELTARMRAAMRHCARPENDTLYQYGGLTVNLALRQVLVDNQPVSLTPTEYEILRALVPYAGRVLTHKQLIQAVWEGHTGSNAHLLRVNISNLRRKIEQDPLRPRYILTEPGVGYRLHSMEIEAIL